MQNSCHHPDVGIPLPGAEIRLHISKEILPF
jgi:hypothetical protein